MDDEIQLEYVDENDSPELSMEQPNIFPLSDDARQAGYVNHEWITNVRETFAKDKDISLHNYNILAYYLDQIGQLHILMNQVVQQEQDDQLYGILVAGQAALDPAEAHVHQILAYLSGEPTNG